MPNFTVQAADSSSPPRVSGIAYTGGKLRQYWSDLPIVVDLAGMQIGATIPLLADHFNDTTTRLGLVTASVSSAGLQIEGTIVSETARAKEITAQGKAGADWQLSIGADILGMREIADEPMQINGQSIEPPFLLVSKSKLAEVSVVAVGADHETHMRISAKALSDPSQTQVSGGQTMPDENVPAVTATPPAVDPVQIAAAAVTQERERIAGISRVCAGDCPAIEARAIAEGWDLPRTQCEVLTAIRAARPTAPAVVTGSATENGPAVLHAAALRAFAVPEKQVLADCGEQATEVAARRYRNGIGLQQLLIEAARANGCQYADFRNYHAEILRAAFSSGSLPGILSNVANKKILASFDAVEKVWELIAAKRAVSDFKAVTNYRLTAALTFDKIGPDGEIPHGTIGEESYGNQAATYARMLCFTRAMQINDDLGAMNQLLGQLGRGAALKLNSVFWTAFMDDAAFFTARNGNLAEGTTTALAIASLTAARLLFSAQADTEGYPLGIMPKYLLTPRALEVAGRQYMNDTTVVATGSTDSVITNGNPHAGLYTPISSSYLTDSATAWHLLADPDDMATIEVAFLNGVERPTIQSADADFETLGIQMRGFFDFGVAKQDYRAAVKMTGATAASV